MSAIYNEEGLDVVAVKEYADSHNESLEGYPGGESIPRDDFADA